MQRKKTVSWWAACLLYRLRSSLGYLGQPIPVLNKLGTIGGVQTKPAAMSGRRPRHSEETTHTDETDSR